jgi:transposase
MEFVELRVIPRMVEQGLNILVMDNAAIHKNRRLVEICATHDIKLKYLPPYSPDLNPIESTFKDLKAWIKRYHQLMFDFVSFDGFLDFAVRQNMGRNAVAYYKACGYSLDAEEW